MGGDDAVATPVCLAATEWVHTAASSRAAVDDSSALNMVTLSAYGAFPSSQIAATASSDGASSSWPTG